MRIVLGLCGLLLLMGACKEAAAPIDYYRLPTFTDENKTVVNMVVEIPAGTNKKIEFDPQTGKFEQDIENNQPRVIRFLPYPANYGFIPSTYMDPAQGGDGDALDIILIAEQLPVGAIVPVRPLATMLLEDEGELDHKIVAIPADSSLQIFPVEHFETLMIDHNAVLQLLRDWFVHYKGLGIMQFKGWKNDQYTLSEIKRWERAQ